MKTLSIRTRVTAAFLLLITMALVEAAVVLYVQRESSRAIEDAARTQMILVDHFAVARALDAMRAAFRGFLITGHAREQAEYDAQGLYYERAIPPARALITDEEQRARFARIVTMVTEWRALTREVMEQRKAGADVTARFVNETAAQFEALQREMDAFERRQTDISTRAGDLAQSRVRAATITLTAIPLVAVVFMFGLLVATDRAILTPLLGLTRSARRLAGGDYEAPLPVTRNDEIGVLVGAFSEMRSAVHARASDAATAEQRIRTAHAELLAIINTVPAALVILDPDGSIRMQNKAAEHLLGTAPDTPLARKTYWQGFAMRDGAGRPLRIRDIPPVRALSGVEVIGEEIDVQRADGHRAVILVGAAPLRNAQGLVTGAVAGFHDITRLRELDRMKDEFVAIVSHELRTPLTAIRGSLQLLLADNAVSDPDNQQLLVVALKSCDRLVRIINDMLDISKIEAGQFKLRIGPLVVRNLVQQAVDGVESVAAPAGVALVVDVAADIAEISGDADRLTQALVNLLSNVVKFAPRGSTITVSARETPEAVVFSVADRGQGIAQDDIARLFRKFQQLDDAGTRRAGGTGLGLSITKAIIEEHGGTISVDSVVGRGTTFTFTIPRAERSPGTEAAAVASPRPATAAIRTVLIVDDNDASRGTLAQAMRVGGFRILEASTGAEAVEAARRHRPDAITLSVSSQERGSRRALEELARDPATMQIPIVIAIDGGAPITSAEKPFDISDLVSRVQRMLHGRVHATVLVADDDADLRLVLRETLGRHGFRVIEAADGREAIDTAAREVPDLALLDLRMPRVHGHDVIRALRKNEATAHMPIIVLSGSAGERHSLESLVLGANMFLAKPAEPHELVREIDRLLRQDRAEPAATK